MRLALLRLRQKVNFRLVRLLLIGMDASIFHTGILYTIIIYKNLTKSSLIKNNLFIYIPCLIQHFDYPITDYSTVRTQWVFTFVIYSRRVVPVKRNQLWKYSFSCVYRYQCNRVCSLVRVGSRVLAGSGSELRVTSPEFHQIPNYSCQVNSCHLSFMLSSILIVIVIGGMSERIFCAC